MEVCAHWVPLLWKCEGCSNEEAKVLAAKEEHRVQDARAREKEMCPVCCETVFSAELGAHLDNIHTEVDPSLMLELKHWFIGEDSGKRISADSNEPLDSSDSSDSGGYLADKSGGSQDEADEVAMEPAVEEEPQVEVVVYPRVPMEEEVIDVEPAMGVEPQVTFLK